MRFLFATFEGGGHVTAPLLVAETLQSQGHDVLVISDACNQAAALHKNLPFQTWRRAPERGGLGNADSGLEDWRTRWPPSVIKRLCDGVIASPALAYARDTLEIASVFRPDAIIANELLFGVMMAAETLRKPLALLTASLWCYPTRKDLPPFGPGFAPAAHSSDRFRDRVTRGVLSGLFNAGLADLNRGRIRLGLAPLERALDQLRAADRILIGASQAFDYDAATPPPGFHYCGPLFETPDWAEGAVDLPKNGRANVLISFSTTFQNQKPVMARAMAAVARLPVNGIVTLGPAVDPAGLPTADNITVLAHASHDVIVPQCQAVVCHGGHGTVLRPLSHGVPIVALPMGRDHPDNAARLEWLGAGVRLAETASVPAISKAIERVLTEPAFRSNAEAFVGRLDDRARSPERAASLLVDLVRNPAPMAVPESARQA